MSQALVGRALAGLGLVGPPGPLWASCALVGWALVSRSLAGRALVTPLGPLWAPPKLQEAMLLEPKFHALLLEIVWGEGNFKEQSLLLEIGFKEQSLLKLYGPSGDHWELSGGFLYVYVYTYHICMNIRISTCMYHICGGGGKRPLPQNLKKTNDSI